METTTGIFRHIHELGRSGPVRWLLGRAFGSSPRAVRVEQAEFAPMGHWQDLFWEHGRRTPVAPRAQASAAGQPDLFGWLIPEPSADRSAVPAASPARPAAESAPRTRAERLSKPAPAKTVRKLRMAPTSMNYADSRRTAHREEIARLLEVNEGVNGVRRMPAVEMPRHRFFAQVDLWKGRPIGTPFVMGN